MIAVEYRRRAAKEHKVHLVSRLISTRNSSIAGVRFDVLLNRANPNFTFLVSLALVPRNKTVIFQRFVLESESTFISRWENVHLSVDMPANSTAFLLFEAIIPSGSQGFYVAVDNIKVRAEESKRELGLYILTRQ